jgi:hypothetical protein
MKGIREARMRRAVVAEAIAATPPDDAAELLGDLVTRGGSRDPAVTAALDALAGALGREELLAYDRRSVLYAVAVRAGRPEVARLLFHDVDLGDPEELTGGRPVVPRGRPLSLGERKSLARGQRHDLLQHLLRDPHPDVIEVLLANPRLTEADVLVIASRRPQLARALEAVSLNERWGCRYRVKRALVMNPHTPVALAARLAVTLRRADLKAVAADGHLAPPLREHARELLAGRAAARSGS